MLTAIGDVMRRCYERGWLTTRDGNCSLRRTDSRILYVTPSGWRKTIIHPEHMVKVRLDDENQPIIAEGTHPSGELHMHWGILAGATSVRAVLHAHPTHIVAAMYRGFDLQALASQFPEIFRYTRVGPSVAAAPAISKELGDLTTKALGVQGPTLEFDIVGQHNHGATSVAKDPWTAYEHMERLNHICEIALASHVTPDEVKQRAAAQ